MNSSIVNLADLFKLYAYNRMHEINMYLRRLHVFMEGIATQINFAEASDILKAEILDRFSYGFSRTSEELFQAGLLSSETFRKIY